MEEKTRYGSVRSISHSVLLRSSKTFPVYSSLPACEIIVGREIDWWNSGTEKTFIMRLLRKKCIYLLQKYMVGIDVGGTFTDVTAYDLEASKIITAKSPTTPPTFVNGVMNALGETGISARDAGLIIHTTTLTSNSVVERTGPETALITTKGQRDVIEIARADRGDMFDPTWSAPAPLVKRRNRFTLNERLDYKGKVVQQLEEDEVSAVARIIAKRNIKAVAICFINSFVNPEHEIKAAEIIKKELPAVEVCISYDVNPEILEYERASTTVLNAYLRPVVTQYIEDLLASLSRAGFMGTFLLGVLSGGVMSPAKARVLPVALSEAGPSAGVISASFWAKLAGYGQVFSFDMGGTTTKFGIIEEGTPKTVPQIFVEYNKPIRYPSIDVRSIGEGGGSIAWADEAGLLEVGPRSAGAIPGPACYNLGGKEPTITDAHVVLGRLDQRSFLGGKMKIYPELATDAIKKIGSGLDKSVKDTAAGILEIAEQKMVDEARAMILRAGIDPREFMVLAFGGAGPLHGANFAKQLNINKILVPPNPGIFGATGCLLLDYRHDFTLPVVKKLQDLNDSGLNSSYAKIEAEATKTLLDEGVQKEAIRLERYIDMRYFRKAGHVSLLVSNGESLENILERFYDKCKETFGYLMPRSVAVEIINVRIAAHGHITKPVFSKFPSEGSSDKAVVEQRDVYFQDSGFVKTKVYDRSKLHPSNIIEGPALVQQNDSTVLIPPWAKGRVDDYLNMLIEKS